MSYLATIMELSDELVDVLTMDATGVDAGNEKDLQEYGENAWFAEHDEQQELVYHSKVDAALKIAKETFVPDDYNRLETALKEFSLEYKAPENYKSEYTLQDILEECEA